MDPIGKSNGKETRLYIVCSRGNAYVMHNTYHNYNTLSTMDPDKIH